MKMKALHMTETLARFKKAKLPLWAAMLNGRATDRRKVSLSLFFSTMIEVRILIMKVTNQGPDPTGSGATLVGEAGVSQAPRW